MIPVTIAILVSLFLIQRQGTARLGRVFGPVILVWLCFLAVTGAIQVAHTPQVLSAVFPWHAIRFLVINKLQGFVPETTSFYIGHENLVIAEKSAMMRRPPKTCLKRSILAQVSSTG